FAGQDFYGAQHYAASFIFEPMGYALGNLFTTVEVFDPPSTSAMEVRVVPFRNIYVKSMVLAGDPSPFSHNPTGLVPQFRGTPVSVSEIGFTPGKKATSIRAFDSRKPKGLLRAVPVRRRSQSRKIHNTVKPTTKEWELPVVLDGEPGDLACGPQRGQGLGRNRCLRLEPA